MDIQLISKSSLKLKLKKTTLVINPDNLISKTDADAIISFDNNIDSQKVNNYRVIINAPGDYEVGGLKILSERAGGSNLIYSFSLENFDLGLVKASSIQSLSSDKVKDYDVVIIDCDAAVNQSVLTAMEPSLIILYGDNSKEEVKNLGKESINPTSKISISEDKLPSEMEVFLLG